MSAPSTASARSLLAVAATVTALVMSLLLLPAPQASAAPDLNWQPRFGVEFNSPVGRTAAKYRIHRKVRAAIDNAPRGSRIHVMSWNIMSQSMVDAMLAAQRRGVVLRVLMDRINIEEQDNRAFPRLRRGFNSWNRQRNITDSSRRSVAKLCTESCRGEGGAAHGKYFLFKRTGKAWWVTMHGGYNMTDAASQRQWNELYTFRDNRAVYDFANRVFHEMWRDRPVRKQFTLLRNRSNIFYFTPFRGPDYDGDPALWNLKQVKCKGARNTRKGRTIVRAAPDVMRHARGNRYADQFIRMHRQGCDVKIGYTVLGIDINRRLRAAGVPLRHLTQDFDGDKVFDRYFHLKVITVRGVIGNNLRGHLVVNGSANLSGVASASDEHTSLMRGMPVLTKKYEGHINWWFDNFPASARVQARYRGVDVDPYRDMELD